MSLEANITELTASIRELIARLDAGAAIGAASASAEKTTRTRRTKAEIEAAQAAAAQPLSEVAPINQPVDTGFRMGGQPIAPPPSAPEVEDAVIVSKPAAAAPAAISYDNDVRPLLVKAMEDERVGTVKVAALIKSFGAAKGSEIAADKLGAFAADVQKLLDNAAQGGALL